MFNSKDFLATLITVTRSTTATDAPGKGERRQSASDAVFGALRLQILRGELKPGTRLIDATVAVEQKVSRNTAREALRLLVADELATWTRNLGYMVRSLSPNDVRNLYQARRVIEIGAVRQSANAPDEHFVALEKVTEHAEAVLAAGAWSGVGTASLNFHQAIVRLAGSATLDAFFEKIAAQLRLAFAVMNNEAKFQARWIPRDREIANLILSGNRAEAITELERYLVDSETSVVDAIRAAERESA